jgi:hypothetical protein
MSGVDPAGPIAPPTSEVPWLEPFPEARAIARPSVAGTVPASAHPERTARLASRTVRSPCSHPDKSQVSSLTVAAAAVG